MYYDPLPFHDGNKRVYAELVDDSLHIHVGDCMIRMLPLSELPDHIRTKLAMIHAWNWQKNDGQYIGAWSPMFDFPFLPEYPEASKDIGWRFSVCEYVLVLPEKVLEELRGEVSRG
jgi:hypothetical protein